MTRENAGTQAVYHHRGTPRPMEISAYLKSSQAMRPVSTASARKNTAVIAAPNSTRRRRRAGVPLSRKNSMRMWLSRNAAAAVPAMGVSTSRNTESSSVQAKDSSVRERTTTLTMGITHRAAIASAAIQSSGGLFLEGLEICKRLQNGLGIGPGLVFQ